MSARSWMCPVPLHHGWYTPPQTNNFIWTFLCLPLVPVIFVSKCDNQEHYRNPEIRQTHDLYRCTIQTVSSQLSCKIISTMKWFSWSRSAHNICIEYKWMCVCISRTEYFQLCWILTTLRWRNVWTKLWERWWTLAAWSLQQETRNCSRANTGWSAGDSVPLDRGEDCTTHKVSVWGDSNDRDDIYCEWQKEYSQQEWKPRRRVETEAAEKGMLRSKVTVIVCAKSPWLSKVSTNPACGTFFSCWDKSSVFCGSIISNTTA